VQHLLSGRTTGSFWDRLLFGRNRRLDEVTQWGAYLEGIGSWRKLHKEEIYVLYFSPNTIRKIKSKRIRWAGHVGRVWLKLNAYILEDQKINDPVEEWAYPGTWCLYWSETNKIGCCGPKYFGSKLALVNTVMNFGLLRNARSFFTGWEIGLWRTLINGARFVWFILWPCPYLAPYSVYIGMTGEWLNWQGFVRKQWVIMGVMTRNFSGGTKRNHERAQHG